MGQSNITLAQASSDPSSAEAAQREITRVNEEIAALESLVASRSKERDKLQLRLRNTDTAIGSRNLAIEKTQKALEARQRKINNLEAQGVAIERDISSRQSKLENAVSAFSVLRQGGDLKILLGDSNAQETERHQAYFNILLEEQLLEIDAFKRTVSALEINQQQLSETQALQQAERNDLAEQREGLLEERSSQREVIADLSALLLRDGAQIEALREDASRLNILLEELTRRMADLQLSGDFQDFAALAGTLRAPVDGNSETQFGEKRDRGDLRWQGWMIRASRGTPVRAIHSGRVVYADWLRGQGLLTIVDHGNGWMSLYGRNESLLKESGDWVSPGEEIARVGASGGATIPSLYFEIRSDGVPVDPGKWIK